MLRIKIVIYLTIFWIKFWWFEVHTLYNKVNKLDFLGKKRNIFREFAKKTVQVIAKLN